MADPRNRQGVRGIAATATDPRRGKQRALAARGAAGALVLGILAVVLQSAATATPAWGYFTTPDPGISAEKGYFGPWRQCKLLLYNRERCGTGVSRFQPVMVVWVAGIAAAISSGLLGLLVLLAVLQLAMASSAKRMVISYSTTLIGKVALGTLASCLSIVAASLFALQTDDRANSYIITRGEGFYMQWITIKINLSERKKVLKKFNIYKLKNKFLFQLGAIVLNFGVLISSVYEGIYARRGGDPTKIREVVDVRSTTINNPGYREHSTNGISMTDASGKPYVGGVTNGSMASVTTSGSVGSTISPLRSSLKKPKPLGIQNPGFSTHSPTLSRNGSHKKVRIQTHSTEV
ncbi:GSCOCG00002100001-RA-CDS [Cotesia congregata]|nr:GSCOCG00002100001-RA-CDS [Cotesia congregata]